MKTYQATDIYYHAWDQVPRRLLPLVFATANRISDRFDHYSVFLLRLLAKKKRLHKKLTRDQLYDTRKIYEFISQPCPLFLIKTIRTGFKKYHAPSDRMENCTLLELAMADTYFIRYRMTEDPMWLDKSIAVLYRPEKWFWCIRKHFTDSEDIRQKYNSDKTEQHAKSISKVDQYTKDLLVFFFLSSLEQIMKRCPNLFPPPLEDEEGNIKETELKDHGPMWQDLMYDLSETAAFRGIDNAMNANAYMALDYLEKKAIEVADFKAKNKL